MLNCVYCFNLEGYCEGLEERGVIIRWKPCLVLLMHLPSFTAEYGIWHLRCSGVGGLAEEWLRGRRGLWRWEPLALWQYLPFPQPVSVPSYPFKEETSLHRVLGFWSAWCHLFMRLQPPVAAALGARVVWADDPQLLPSKGGCVYVHDALPLHYQCSGWCGLFVCFSATLAPVWKTNLQNNHRKTKERARILVVANSF